MHYLMLSSVRFRPFYIVQDGVFDATYEVIVRYIYFMFILSYSQLPLCALIWVKVTGCGLNMVK